MSNILKAPIFWFLITGCLFFVIDKVVREQVGDDTSIIISDGDIQRIRDQWQSQSGTVLSNTLLKGLLEEDIQERRLFREAIALGLDRDDVIVKRRLVQKLRFLTEDLSSLETPDKNILEDYFDKNKERYKSSAKISFRHIYFSFQSRGESADKDALKLYSSIKEQPLMVDEWKKFGDPFMLGLNFTNRSQPELSMQFGSEYVAQLPLLSEKQWSQPIRSSFGYHLVWLELYQSPMPAAFDDIQLRLLDDYQTMQKQKVFKDYMKILKKKFPVIFNLEDEDILSIMTLSSENEILY